MKKHQFNIHKLLTKFCIIILLIYLFVFIGSAIVGNIIFFSLNHYKRYIENYVTQNTDYELNIDNIKTKFTYDYLPEIILNGISIRNKADTTHKLTFKQINLNLSYASLWKFSIIFNKIAISSTKLAIEYLPNGNILLNGILINNSQVKPTTTKHSFDLENWLLQQQAITLNNIDFSLWNKKNSFTKVGLKNINVVYINQPFHDKHLQIKVTTPNTIKQYSQNELSADLRWNGNKFEDYSQWKSANFKLKTDSDSPIFYRSIKQYIPNLGFISKYAAKTAIDGTMKNGQLTVLNANFDLNNISYILAKSTDIVNFPIIKGSLCIKLNAANNTYAINANNLQISTNKGIMLDNKNITGYYTIDKHGQISIYNSNLSGINNLLSIMPKTKGISIDGRVNSMIVSWDGNIFKPSNYLLDLKFESIGLIADGNKTPKINNISGHAVIGKESGNLSLNLNNSTFVYKELFHVPYDIKKLSSSINWQIKSESLIVVNIQPTTINASDFNIVTHGKYIYTPNSSGYLELYANLDRIPTDKVGFYLPKSIDNANKWLQKSLIGGYAESATLTLKGWLDDFPFQKGNGEFYIDANVDNASLIYVKGWPMIDRIHGKFMIRNQKIIITADKARLNKNSLTDINVVIPDMTADKSYLVATGYGNGSTTNFLNYLKHTPINKMINEVPNKINATGNGKVKIYLKVPFSNPDTTTVKGTYTFLNNHIKFDFPVPPLENTTGNLDFTNRSITISSITARTLEGKLNLHANTAKNGVMYFTANTENIDYNKLAQLYLPAISPIVSGSASTKIDFNINSHGIQNITANSNLRDVEVLAPRPLGKNPDENSSLEFYMNHLVANNGYSMSFTYDNALFGNTTIDSSGSLTNGNIRIGKNIQLAESLPAVVKVSVSPERFDLIQWLHMLRKISYKMPTEQHNLKSSPNSQSVALNDHPSALPIDIGLQTNEFYIENLSFGLAHAEAYVTNKVIAFNMTSSAMDGYGVYQLPQNKFDLMLYFVNFTNPHQNQDTAININKSPLPYISESQEKSLKQVESNFDKIFESMQNQAESYANSVTKKLDFPTTTIHTKQLYFRGNDLGNLEVHLKAQGANLVIESSKWIGKYGVSNFNAINYCFACNRESAFVSANFKIVTKDLGKALSNLRYDGILTQTSGSINGHVQWRGMLDDLDVSTIAGVVDLKLKNGRFLKVNTGSLLGGIMGIISLQTIVNVVSLNFGSIFANGYAFSDLEAKAYILNNTIYLKSLDMSSTMAVVGLRGRINLGNATVNLYLTVTPSLGVGVAIGAGIITLNPIVAIATYLAELTLRNPVNKLFTFTYHLTGSIKNPKIEQIGVSKQIKRNISSTVGQ